MHRCRSSFTSARQSRRRGRSAGPRSSDWRRCVTPSLGPRSSDWRPRVTSAIGPRSSDRRRCVTPPLGPRRCSRKTSNSAPPSLPSCSARGTWATLDGCWLASLEGTETFRFVTLPLLKFSLPVESRLVPSFRLSNRLASSPLKLLWAGGSPTARPAGSGYTARGAWLFLCSLAPTNRPPRSVSHSTGCSVRPPVSGRRGRPRGLSRVKPTSVSGPWPLRVVSASTGQSSGEPVLSAGALPRQCRVSSRLWLLRAPEVEFLSRGWSRACAAEIRSALASGTQTPWSTRLLQWTVLWKACKRRTQEMFTQSIKVRMRLFRGDVHFFFFAEGKGTKIEWKNLDMPPKGPELRTDTTIPNSWLGA